jgi:hypothetical protein
MKEILDEIQEECLRKDTNKATNARRDVYEPETWCGVLRHQIRLADRAACSLAADEITGVEERSLIAGYRAQLIKIAAVATAATESLDRILAKRRRSSDKAGDLAKRAEGRTHRRLEK